MRQPKGTSSSCAPAGMSTPAPAACYGTRAAIRVGQLRREEHDLPVPRRRSGTLRVKPESTPPFGLFLGGRDLEGEAPTFVSFQIDKRRPLPHSPAHRRRSPGCRAVDRRRFHRRARRSGHIARRERAGSRRPWRRDDLLPSRRARRRTPVRRPQPGGSDRPTHRRRVSVCTSPRSPSARTAATSSPTRFSRSGGPRGCGPSGLEASDARRPRIERGTDRSERSGASAGPSFSS